MNAKWDTSYTKRVWEGLLRGGSARAIVDAAQLLRGYHDDMHTAYEQRDAERAKLKAKNRQIDDLLKENEKLRAEQPSSALKAAHDYLVLKAAHDYLVVENTRLRRGTHLNVALVAPKPKKPDYFRCEHHPISLENFFTNVDACEYGCHLNPLRWFDAGTNQCSV